MRRVLGMVVPLALAAAMMSCSGESSSSTPSADPETTPFSEEEVEGSTYILPGPKVYPEGIAVSEDQYYVGSTNNGDIYRGGLEEQRAAVFVPGVRGHSAAVGMKATDTRLVVANGAGVATVFDRSTGSLVAQFTNSRGNASLVNDVAIAPNGDAYLTDTTLSKIYRIPADALAQPEPEPQALQEFIDFEGTDFPVTAGSANGIAVTPDGQFLIVAHYQLAELYRVSIDTQEVSSIDLNGGSLTTPDGVVLTDTGVLYVVEHEGDSIAKLQLNETYDSGQLLSRTTSPSIQCPSTAAIAGDRLLVVNSQFCDAVQLPFTVSSIALP